MDQIAVYSKLTVQQQKFLAQRNFAFQPTSIKYQYYDKCKVQTLRTRLFVTIATNSLEKFKWNQSVHVFTFNLGLLVSR